MVMSMNEEKNKTENEEVTDTETAEETKADESEKAVIEDDTSAAENSDDEKKVPLDFSYYKAPDSAAPKRMTVLAVSCLIFLIVFAGALKTINDKTNKPLPHAESSYTDAYDGSPYAYDTHQVGTGITENGLYYTEYEDHARITQYRDILYPFDITIPDFINNKPVAEVDYYVFSYSVLNSLTVANPECIFFEDGNLPPVDTKVAIIASEDSKAHTMAIKYGNPFTVQGENTQ